MDLIAPILTYKIERKWLFLCYSVYVITSYNIYNLIYLKVCLQYNIYQNSIILWIKYVWSSSLEVPSN